MKESVFEEGLEKELDLIIRYTVHVGNSLTGIKSKYQGENIGYTHVMGRKILSHILTSYDLLKGVQGELTSKILQRKIDFSSVYILLRASLETYLTFNHIFVATDTVQESGFRFDCWCLASHIDRSRFKPTETEHIDFMEKDTKERIELEEKIKSTVFFQQLNNSDKKLILRGIWRTSNTWADLACNAGYTRKYFSMQYNYLSGHAHTSRKSILDINKNIKYDNDVDNLNFIYSVMLSILCKFNFDYINLIPELLHFSNDEIEFALVKNWKENIEAMDGD